MSGSSASPVALAAEKKKWFYHMAQWRDMDGDGKLDLLTARATKNFLGKRESCPQSAPLACRPRLTRALATQSFASGWRAAVAEAACVRPVDERSMGGARPDGGP